MRRSWLSAGRLGLGLTVAMMLGACGGDGGGGDAPDGGGTDAPVPPPPEVTVDIPDLPDQPTPELIARGDSVFHGRGTTGICSTCHSINAEGGAMAPNLTDDEWLNIDGSMAGIARIIVTGVDMPKQHPATMPPGGGSALSDDDLVAVTAYVYSLSRD